MLNNYIMSKLTKFPLADIFDQIGLPDCVRLLEEASRYEPLARRFSDEWYHRRGKRNSAAAARMVHELDLDVGLFRNLLVRLYEQHMRGVARIKQAAKIPEMTQTSVDEAIQPKNFDERVRHLEKSQIFESPKTGGVNVQTNLGIMMNQAALPTFEQDIMQIEEKMRAALPINNPRLLNSGDDTLDVSPQTP